MKRWLAVFLFVIFHIGSAWAQTASNAFSVSGTVLDPNGASISGAQVELLSNNLKIKSAVTDGAGYFTFAGVGAGSYQIQVHVDGFAPKTVELKVGPQSPGPLKIALAIATLQQSTTINADNGTEQLSMETGENHNSNNLTQKELKGLPVFDQDYVAMMSRFLDSGGVGTNGASLVVDGVEANSVGVSASAIKEVKINNDPYSAEFTRPGRGRIEVTTKPGEPEFHGEFNFTFRDAHLNARDAFAVLRPPEQRRIYEGVFTGPINGSAKNTFLISINRADEDLQAVVFAKDGQIRENVATPNRSTLLAGVLTHFFSDSNSFSLRYSYQEDNRKNQGVGGITLPEAGTNNESIENEIRYTQQTIFSANLVNQFRVLIGRETQGTASISPGVRLIVNDSLVGGGAQADQLRTEHHIALTEILSYTSGRNLLKLGFNVPDWSSRGLDNNLNKGGTFSFATLNDLNLGQPYSFTQQQGNGHIVFLEKVIGGFVQDDFKFRPNLMISAGMRYDWQNYFHDNNNFAPRLSFAYSPGSDHKTVIRGGAGYFYDRTGPRPIQDILLFNGSRLRSFILLNPSFPDPLAGGATLSSQPTNIVQLSPDIKLPTTIQYSIGIERQLAKSTTLSATYIGLRGIDLFRSRDINAPLPPDFTVFPNPALGQDRQIEATGHSRSNTLEVSFRGRITDYFTGMMQYRLAKAYDNTGGIASFPPNSYDLSGEWSLANYDRRHRFEMLGTLNPGKLFNLGMAVSLYTGSPYSETLGIDAFNTGRLDARPIGVPRNSLHGPGYADVDLRWSKEFRLTKAKKDQVPSMRFGVDAFNVLNTVNFTSFIGKISSPLFGQAVASQPPRRLQLTARFSF